VTLGLDVTIVEL